MVDLVKFCCLSLENPVISIPLPPPPLRNLQVPTFFQVKLKLLHFLSPSIPPTRFTNSSYQIFLPFLSFSVFYSQSWFYSLSFQVQIATKLWTFCNFWFFLLVSNPKNLQSGFWNGGVQSFMYEFDDLGVFFFDFGELGIWEFWRRCSFCFEEEFEGSG